MSKPVLTDLDFSGVSEIQNAIIQNLASAPSNPKEGQFYFNTTDKTLYVYANSTWKDALAQGTTYSFSTGLTNTAGTITLNQATSGALGGVIVGSNIGVSSGTISVADASTSSKGVIEIATDSEASTGTSETLAVNPKQLATKIGLGSLSVASGSTNYLGYDNTNGQISAKVDTTVTDSSTNLVTSGAVATAIGNAVAGVIIPKASISSVSSLPTLTAAHVGWMYNFSASFTTTSDFVEGAGVEYPAGTNVVVVEYTSGTYKYDVFSGFVDTSSFITASSTNTLTNKTIDADDNTISDLTTSNLKSGVLQTTVRTTSSASDTALASEKAIATALASKAGKYTTTNPALTASSGVCTWTVTHSLGSDVVAMVYEVSSGKSVICDIANTSSTVVTVKFNSAANISAGVYKVVVIGA